MCDLDSNGKLSQEEFNLYKFLTQNTNLTNDEWKFVGGINIILNLYNVYKFI